MLTVVIETRNQEERLARTLGSLVAGVVDGAVREVIVCDLGSTDQTRYVAEHAGCRLIPDGGIAVGAREAKCDWLLLVEPGARLVDGWTEEVAAHISRSLGSARFSRSRRDRLPFLSRVFSTQRALAEGLLISKRQALALAKGRDSGEAIARGLSTRRLTAEILVADPR